MSGNSWVTLATNDSYSLGALVLARSLKRVGTAHTLTVMITPGVSEAMRTQLASVFNVVEEVNILDSKDEKNLALLTRPELGVTFTKLHCWRLTQFSKCVFLDADVLVLQNCDELFDREELSASPDVGWPDCFNSGVFVYRPSIDTYNKLINFALARGSFDGGDQGLLNQFFSDWATKDISRHLPFIYNMCSTATYSYLPAFKQFGQDVKIVHFIGAAKPWLQYLDSETRQVRPSMGSEHLQGILQLWWDIFCNDVHSNLSSEMAGLAGALSQLTLGVARSPEQVALEEHLRKQAWEHGNIDYMGRDSFDNIWRKICQTLAEAPSAEPLPEQSKPASQVSSVVVENITPADDTSPSLREPILVASAHTESNDVTLSSIDAGHLSEKSGDSAENVLSDTVSVPSLKNISSASAGVQIDLNPEPIPETQVLTPVLTSPAPVSEIQDSSLENQTVTHTKGTGSQSAAEIKDEPSLEVVHPLGSQDDTSAQKEASLIDDRSIIKDTEGKMEIVEEIRDPGQVLIDVPVSRDISSELPMETVGIPVSEDNAQSLEQTQTDSSGELKSVLLDTSETKISSVPSECGSEVIPKIQGQIPEQVLVGDVPVSRDISSELPIETVGVPVSEDSTKSLVQTQTDSSEELKSVLLESSETKISSVPSESDSVVTSRIQEAQGEPQVGAAQISDDSQTLPSEISRRVERVSAGNADLIEPVSASEQSSSESTVPQISSDPASLTQKVTVIGPTPPSTPIDTLVVAPSVTPAADTLSVDPSIPDTPPVSAETTKDSVPDASSTASKPISEVQGSSETPSQSVDPKAPIPPKRRHKSQNLDQSGNKSGKAPTKSPKGKK